MNIKIIHLEIAFPNEKLTTLASYKFVLWLSGPRPSPLQNNKPVYSRFSCDLIIFQN